MRLRSALLNKYSHKPHPRIIQLKRQRKIPTPIQQRRIPPSRIQDPIRRNSPIKRRVHLSQNDEIMAMKVNGMRGWNALLAGNLLDVTTVDDEVYEPAVPCVVRVVDSCLEDILKVRGVVDVQDTWTGVVQEQGIVFDFPSVGAVGCFRVEGGDESVLFARVAEVGGVPGHDRTEAGHGLVCADLAVGVCFC